jgi:purine nucleoside phosphorylase
MPIAIITGSGTHTLPGFESPDTELVSTQWGDATITRGVFAGTDVLHV